MKIARIRYQRQSWWSLIEGDGYRLLATEPFTKIRPTKTVVSSRRGKLITPCLPQKIILLGLNYKDHARELQMKIPCEPLLFLKPPSALLNPFDAIRYPTGVKRLDYEAELAVVIGKPCKNASETKAVRSILGYTCLNDVTARDLQKRDGQWTRAKSFDTFCPLGPHIETEFDPSAVSIQLRLNGRLKQDSSTKNFIFKVPRVVSFVSKVMTLYPGDIISTGTPPGIGPLHPGDSVEVIIKGIGTLANRVRR